jgi:hypothetical protein
VSALGNLFAGTASGKPAETHFGAYATEAGLVEDLRELALGG